MNEAQTVGGYAFLVGYGYDVDNLTTTITYPNTKQVVRTYNPRHQLSGVSYDAANLATRLYDTGGRLASTAFANGLTETRGYDLTKKDPQVTSIAVPGVTNFSQMAKAATIRASGSASSQAVSPMSCSRRATSTKAGNMKVAWTHWPLRPAFTTTT